MVRRPLPLATPPDTIIALQAARISVTPDTIAPGVLITSVHKICSSILDRNFCQGSMPDRVQDLIGLHNIRLRAHNNHQKFIRRDSCFVL